MSAPQPTPATSDGDDGDDSPAEDDEFDTPPGEVTDEVSPDDDPFAGSEEAEDEIDVDLAEVDVGEDPTEKRADERLDELDAANADVPNRDDDDPFDGTEDSGSEWASEGAYDGTADTGSPSGPSGMGMAQGAFDAESGALSETINEGAAQLAVVGLPEQYEHNGQAQYKSDLQDEFQEVFETFKLGEFGERTADEYLNVDGEIDPLWGFSASLLVCAVVVLQMRPDGGEIAKKAEWKLRGMA